MLDPLLDPVLTAKLLGRPERTSQLPLNWLSGQTILVTGAGGSIGSVLCKRLSTTNCRSVIAVDNHELALVNLQGSCALELLDVRDTFAIEQLMRQWKPDVVFHTAAYKHLPLLEQFPFAAFENNTLATARLAQLSRELGVRRFILLSSDKASDPVSILGLSKRLAEMTLAGESQAALRCANVLGSSGSVLSIWAQQIAQGKPIAVASAAERLFISHVEAGCALLDLGGMHDLCGLFASAAASPVAIEDLASRFLGVEDRDWPRQDRALGSGEKKREALCSATESLGRTRSEHLLQIVEQAPARVDVDAVLRQVEQACRTRDVPLMREIITSAFTLFS